MATTKYNWKDIQGANLGAKLDNVAKSYTDTRALHIIQLLSSMHKSWDKVDQLRSVMATTLNGLTHRSFAQMLTLDKFIRMCDFDGIELDTINVEKLRKLLFKPPADENGVPDPNSNGLVGWYFPKTGPVQLCEVVNPYSDRNDEIQEAQDLLSNGKSDVGAGVHVLRFQLKKWCDSNKNFREVLQLIFSANSLTEEMTTFLNGKLGLPKTGKQGTGKTFQKLGEYLVKNDGSFTVGLKRDPITEKEKADWTILKNAFETLMENPLSSTKNVNSLRFPRIITWALTTDWTLNGTQLSTVNDRKGGILNLLNEFECIMDADQMDAILKLGLKDNVALSGQLNDFIGETVGDRYNRVTQLTRDANSWLKNNDVHDVLEAKGSDGICTNKLILQVLTRWKEGRIGFTNIGEEIKLCFEDYERFFLLPDPNFVRRFKQSFNSYAEAKSYVLYGITRPQLSAGAPIPDHPSLDVTYNLNPSVKVKWRDYFQRAIRRPYKQYGETPRNQQDVRTGRNGSANLLLDTTPDQTNRDFSRLDRNPTPAIKAVQLAGVSSAGQCCAVCSKKMRPGSNKKWSTYLGGRSSGASAIGQSFDVDHIANLIYNELFKLNSGGHGFLNTCTGCNQHFKSEKIWCPSYNLWYYLLDHAYDELRKIHAKLDNTKYKILTPDQFYECYPWPGWNFNGIPGIVDRKDYTQNDAGVTLPYDSQTKISEFNMYCTINSYGRVLPARIDSSARVPKPPTKNGNQYKRTMWDEGQGMGSTKNAGATIGMGPFSITAQVGKITALNLETIILDRFANIVRMAREESATYEGAILINNILQTELNRLQAAMTIVEDGNKGCNPDPKELGGGQEIVEEYKALIGQFPVVSRFETMIQALQEHIRSGKTSKDMRVVSNTSSAGNTAGNTARFEEERRQQQIIEAQQALARGEAMILSFQESGVDTFDRLDFGRIFPQSIVDRPMLLFFEGEVTRWINQREEGRDALIPWSRDVVRLMRKEPPTKQEYQGYRAMSESGITELLRSFEDLDRFNRLTCEDLNQLRNECLKKVQETQAFAQSFHIGVSKYEEQLRKLKPDTREAEELFHQIINYRNEFRDIITHLQHNTIRFGILYEIFRLRSISILQCAAAVELRMPAKGRDIGESDWYESQDPKSSPPSSLPSSPEKGKTSSNEDDADVVPLAAALSAPGNDQLDAFFSEGSSNSSNNSLNVSDQSNTGEDDLEMHTPNSDDNVGVRTPEKPQGAVAVPPTPGSGNLGGDEQGSPENEARRRRVIPYQSSSSSLGSDHRRSAFSAVSGVDESGSSNNQRPPSRKRERQGEGGEARPPSRLRGDYDGILPFITSLTGRFGFLRGEWVDWDQVDNAITLLIRNNPNGHPNLSREWRTEHSSQARREWFIGYLNHIGALYGRERQVRINSRNGRFQFLEPRGFGGGGRKRTRKKRRKKKKTKRKRKYRKKTKGRKRRRKKRTRRK